MSKSKNVKFNRKAWDSLVKEIIETEGVERMSRVADACNAELGEDGYKVSVEGDDPLTKDDYRATVITATAHAMRHNAKHNTLIQNLHKASGD